MSGESLTKAVVIGSGRMAPGIAAALAAAGLEVAVVARAAEKARAAADLAGGGVVGRELQADSFAGVDLVCESIVEHLDVKADLYESIEPWLEDGAILTTNTSGLPIGGLANGLIRPDRFAGLHFLYPADVTGVVEIIAGEETSAGVLRTLCELAERMGRSPILARRDVPGFVWNRLQAALLREALWLLEEGVADVETIDAAVSEGLAPRWLATGPFAVVDQGGSATWARIAAAVFPYLATGSQAPPELVRRAVQGDDFYRWDEPRLRRIATLRAKALAEARGIAGFRREITPPADD